MKFFSQILKYNNMLYYFIFIYLNNLVSREDQTYAHARSFGRFNFDVGGVHLLDRSKLNHFIK